MKCPKCKTTFRDTEHNCHYCDTRLESESPSDTTACSESFILGQGWAFFDSKIRLQVSHSREHAEQNGYKHPVLTERFFKVVVVRDADSQNAIDDESPPKETP